MEMTKSEFFKWALQKTQYVENEMLSPHNPKVADSEVVDVLSWQMFTHIVNCLLDETIVIKED